MKRRTRYCAVSHLSASVPQRDHCTVLYLYGTNIAPHSNVNLENKIYETEKKSYGLYIIYSELGLACHCPILYPWNMKIY